MPDKAWKSVERMVATLLGGVRTWNSTLDVDVMVPDEKNPDIAVEVKNLTHPTVADLERILAHNRAKALRSDPPLKSALVVKRKGGRGRPTPYLLVIDVESFFAPDVDETVNDEGVK